MFQDIQTFQNRHSAWQKDRTNLREVEDSNEGSLEVMATSENFSLGKHDLVQAMLAVNDLFHLASPAIVSLSHGNVEAWLDVSEIHYKPRVEFTGRSGYDHRFDFVIPKSGTLPERILHAINRPGYDAAQAMAFSWIDTREVRSSESRAYAILNNSEQTVSENVLDAMRNYGVHPVPWSKRDEALTELAA